MLEKKTSKEIFEEIQKESEIWKNHQQTITELIKETDKVWVSQESLIQWLENNTLRPKASCQDSRRQMEASVRREAFKIVLEELKGEKE